MEVKGVYTAGPDPFEELKKYLNAEDVLKLLHQLRAVWGLGHGWGRVQLEFKRFQMGRPITEFSACEDNDCNP